MRQRQPYWILGGVLLVSAACAAQEPDFAGVQKILRQNCLACHQGKAPSGSFDVSKLRTEDSLTSEARRWNRVVARVRNGEMPPKNVKALTDADHEHLTTWIESTLRHRACADGITPAPGPIRRLNRNEYASTVRDLLNVHFNAARDLPADGAGGEGFDNAAETLFLSPIHAEKYLEAAKQALDYGVRDPRSRAAFITQGPSDKLTPEQAAEQVVSGFLPRAFRRPVTKGEVDRYLGLFRTALARGESYDGALLFAMQGVMVSPNFLFRLPFPNPSAQPRLAESYEMASRLSYFLWGSMPDQALFDLAAAGKLQDPVMLKQQVGRMLRDVKARDFAERFVEQWLGTRELGRDIKPDAQLFPAYYDEEVQSAIRYEPILFFQEILAENLPLLNLIDSNFTILTNKLARHYEIKVDKLSQQPKRADLPENSHRGGLTGMAAVLAVSSYPRRTSPVLRGKWILDSLLGTPPPPPPPNVPELKTENDGGPARTLREHLELHRANPVCAGCHSRIDPLGFSLENYDVVGRWRTQDAGKPVDTRGQLPDGPTFEGPAGLKSVLMTRKDLFVRNLTTKLLGYALGRGLGVEDSCAVDAIVAKLKENEYRSHILIEEIILSVPFRYQPGTQAGLAVEGSATVTASGGQKP